MTDNNFQASKPERPLLDKLFKVVDHLEMALQAAAELDSNLTQHINNAKTQASYLIGAVTYNNRTLTQREVLRTLRAEDDALKEEERTGSLDDIPE